MQDFGAAAKQAAQDLFPDGTWSEVLADELLEEAYRYGDYTFGLADANTWCLESQGDPDLSVGRVVDGQYVPSTDIVNACEDFLLLHGGLEGASRQRIGSLYEARLNTDRVDAGVTRENPDHATIHMLARPHGGVKILTPPEFQPNWLCGLVTDPRSITAKAGEAPVARMVMESFVQPGLAFCVTEKFARKHIPNTHESPSCWACKQNKRKGRNCMNCSYKLEEKWQALNSQWLREEARKEWGVVYHTTIQRITLMIQEAIDENGGSTKGLVLWKMDLNGAFLLLTFQAEDVHLMATRITDSIMVYILCGTFGWGGTPMAFQVVTRVILWELRNNKALNFRGRVEMYVDDLMGICRRTDWKHVEGVVTRFCESLLGPGCIAPIKTECGRRIDGIGYSLDLDIERVGIARHNILKALYVNLNVDVDKTVPVRVMQALAAHASRYKTVCPPIAPFARALHQSYRKAGQHRNATVRLQDPAKRSVWLLRALLVYSEVDKKKFTRPFQSFKLKGLRPSWVIEYDGSLDGIGIIWFEVSAAGVETAVGCASIDIGFLELRKWADAHGLQASGYQNTIEFLASFIGMRELSRRGVHDVNITVRGDSKSALAWAEKDSFRSDNVGNASMAYVVQRWQSGIEIGLREHLSHGLTYDWNWRCDWLSRGRTREEILTEDAKDPNGRRLAEDMVTWDIDRGTEILELCTPTRTLGTQKEFHEWWKRLFTLLF